MTWHSEAACRNLPASVFYPPVGVNADPARTVCDRCPVAVECAQAGAHEAFGVWAGTTPDQRGTRTRSGGHGQMVTVCPECGLRFWVRRESGRQPRCQTCKAAAA